MPGQMTVADVSSSSEVMSDHPLLTGATVIAQEVTMSARRTQDDQATQPEGTEPEEQVEGTEPDAAEVEETDPAVEPESTEAEGGEDDGVEPEVTETEDDGVEPETTNEVEDESAGPAEAEDAEDEDDEDEKPAKKKLPFVFTPYQATKVLNQMLIEAEVKNPDGTQKKVNSPMLYIYARAGRYEIRKSPEDKKRAKADPNYRKGQKPRWEVFPLTGFRTWAEEYVKNAKEGVTAAQRRKALREEGAEINGDASEGPRSLEEALEMSLAAAGGSVEGAEDAGSAEAE